jgi:hypothetical protein
MTEYNLSYSGEQVNEAIGKARDHITPIDTSLVAGSTAAVTGGAIKNYVDTLEAKVIGVSQTWSDERSNRTAGVSYQNTTGRPIMVVVSYAPTGNSTQQIQVSDDNVTFVTLANLGFDPSESATSFIVPHNYYYRTVGVLTERTWAELR